MVNFKQKNQPAVKVSPGVINVRRSVTAAVVAAVLSLIAILVFSLFAFLKIVPESFIPALSVIVTLAGGFFAGYLIALSVPSMGLVNGLCAGAFYFLIMFVLSAIFAPGFSINKNAIKNAF